MSWNINTICFTLEEEDRALLEAALKFTKGEVDMHLKHGPVIRDSEESKFTLEPGLWFPQNDLHKPPNVGICEVGCELNDGETLKSAKSRYATDFIHSLQQQIGVRYKEVEPGSIYFLGRNPGLLPVEYYEYLLPDELPTSLVRDHIMGVLGVDAGLLDLYIAGKKERGVLKGENPSLEPRLITSFFQSLPGDDKRCEELVYGAILLYRESRLLYRGSGEVNQMSLPLQQKS